MATVLLSALTGCGPYAWRGPEPQPNEDEVVGVWVSEEGGSVEIAADGGFEADGIPARYSSSGWGTWRAVVDTDRGCTRPGLVLVFDAGSVVCLYSQPGLVFRGFYFEAGDPDMADWYRLGPGEPDD